MRLDRTFYLGWFLLVLCGWLNLLGVGVTAQTTQLQDVLQEEPSSGEGEDTFPMGDRNETEITSRNETLEHVEEPKQDEIELEEPPDDHFIWTKSETNGYIQEDTEFMGHVMMSFDDAYLSTQCSERCMSHVPKCNSFNFEADTFICQLNTESDVTIPAALAHNNTGSTYYRSQALSTRDVSFNFSLNLMRVVHIENGYSQKICRDLIW